jgi:hypothetical protein
MMSTKNLARTVIEGGRTRWSCWLRRQTLRDHRAAERATLRKLQTGGEADGVAFASRESGTTMFADKLGPALRWLERQVGRPWNIVRSELLERFDTRTTPGRHIVFCHMFPWVEDDAFRFSGRYFEVDAHGVLRKLPDRRHRRPRAYPPLPRPKVLLERWLAGRRVGERGGPLFWFLPTPAGAYRQHHRLEDADAALWRSLPAWFREHHEFRIPSPSTSET